MAEIVLGPSHEGGQTPEHADDATYAEAIEVLRHSRFPALILEVPSERIAAASPSASLMLNPAGGDVTGHNFEDYAVGQPSGVLDIVLTGRLNGFEAVRDLHRADGPDVNVTLWVRKFGSQLPVRFVLVVLASSEELRSAHPEAAAPEPVAVVGTTDDSMLIEKISSGALSLFGSSPAALAGRSLVSLVAEKDRADYLHAMSQVAGSDNSFALYVDVNVETIAGNGAGNGSQHPGAVSCQLLILPLQPAPRCVFVFVRTPRSAPLDDELSDLRGVLHRLTRSVEVTAFARRLDGSSLTDADLPGLDQLTAREREIVQLLANGDRVPAIAKSLFLSQSTVRSHLAAVFTKLGLTGQQELMNVVHHPREARPPGR